MSTVYVIQQNLKRNEEGFMVPRFDLTEAGEFGSVKIIIPHGMTNGDEVCTRLRENLRNYTDADYILPVGSPTIIGWAIHYAATYNDGFVKTLQWNGRSKKYEVIQQVIK